MNRRSFFGLLAGAAAVPFLPKKPKPFMRVPINTSVFIGNNALAHTHTVNDPGHSHSIYDPPHTHNIRDPGHCHGGPPEGWVWGTNQWGDRVWVPCNAQALNWYL